MRVRLFVSGRGYHAAERLPEELSLDDHATLDDALLAVTALLPPGGLGAEALVAVSGEHLGTVSRHRQRSLRDGEELVIIVPVAGG
jgi:hypothetical protein